MEVSDVAKLKALEDENQRSPSIVTEQTVNIASLKIVAPVNY